MRNLAGGLVAVLLVGCNDSAAPLSFCEAIGGGREGVPARAQANNQLALNLETSLAAKGGNVFFSPYSLSVALGMVYEGARGSSASALAKTAGFDPDAGVTGLGFAQLACTLAEDAMQGGNQLVVGDAIFAQKGKAFLPSFLSALQDHYDAPATLVDFAGNPAAAAQTIDAWVAQVTQGTIPMLLSPGDVADGAQLVLVNAVYFHGTWANAFDPKSTMPGPFTTEAGMVVQVPTMSAFPMAGLMAGSSSEPTVLELPYTGSDAGASLVLDVILPPENQSLASFESGLTVTDLNGWFGTLVSEGVYVSLPKLAFDPRYDLSGDLAKLGMGPLFDASRADLSGVDGQHDLFIQWVIQQAHLVVDETGTVASAATGVSIGLTSYEAPPPQVLVNRPFLLILRDVPTGAFLFYGRVADPSHP